MTRMEADLPENPAIPIRTRFFDDALVRVVSDPKIAQVVALAAGMDARAFRLDLPTIFEIDQPALLELKESRLVAAGATARCDRISVAADLIGPWAADLVHAGFDDASPSVFLAEGLLGYLEARRTSALRRTRHAGRSWELPIGRRGWSIRSRLPVHGFLV
jgi:methyltransferase (TIGR00027 family)